MQGTVTKKHIFLIFKAFGLRKAIKVLFSLEPVALTVLMKGR